MIATGPIYAKLVWNHAIYLLSVVFIYCFVAVAVVGLRSRFTLGLGRITRSAVAFRSGFALWLGCIALSVVALSVGTLGVREWV